MKFLVHCLLLSCSTFLLHSPIFAMPRLDDQTKLSRTTSLTTDPQQLLDLVSTLEQNWDEQYRNHLNRQFSRSAVTPQIVQQNLQEVTEQTKSRAAFIWINPYPNSLSITISTGKTTENYEIEVGKAKVVTQVKALVNAIKNPYLSSKQEYLPPAQQLYQWIIQPLLPTLNEQNIDSLVFCLGKGLRVLPFAALHDGENFLIEKYAVSRLPAFSLTNMRPNSLNNSAVLAMGASEFQNLISLPAVPIELATITGQLWQGETFLNEEFTLNNLSLQLQTEPFGIVHFATHAKIESGALANSYIQLWNEQLNLNEFPSLSEQQGWSNVNLLVLSACETALISEENNTIDEAVEMSFAGLALQAGVKSVIASSWDVSDQGTLGLMAQFYEELQTAPTKTIALQRAQLALLKKNVRIEGQTLSNLRSSTPLPETLVPNRPQDFSHPYYWATFTVIGNPW